MNRESVLVGLHADSGALLLWTSQELAQVAAGGGKGQALASQEGPPPGALCFLSGLQLKRRSVPVGKNSPARQGDFQGRGQEDPPTK